MFRCKPPKQAISLAKIIQRAHAITKVKITKIILDNVRNVFNVTFNFYFFEGMAQADALLIMNLH